MSTVSVIARGVFPMKRVRSEYGTADEVEAAFYAAFSLCDLAAMQSLWSRSTAVCVHPGAEPLIGYDAVMRSWEGMFRDAERPNVRIKVLKRIVNEDLAVHMVEEHISTPGVPEQGAVVFATNIYRRERRRWLMSAHNASVMSVRLVRSRTLQ